MKNLDLSRQKYLSHSQYSLFKKDPEEYRRRYIFGEESIVTEAMEFGKRFAEGLELDDSEYLDVEIARLQLPNYPKAEYKIRTTIGGITLLGILDKFDPKKKRIGEIKTGRKWTQGMVDKSTQLKFYDLLILGKYGVQPSEIALYWLPTVCDENGTRLSGEPLKTFKTSHTMTELMVFLADVQSVWKKIQIMRQDSVLI